LFLIQSDVIRNLAEQQSCIFVGRCADYILRDNPRCLNIFISAEIEDRIRRVSEFAQVSSEKAKDLIRHTDKKRAEYYNYYTNKEWGVAKSYHLCINSSLLGESETIAYIIKYIQAFLAKNA
jgi:cytidylate kinase